jgi:hypothetical protein
MLINLLALWIFGKCKLIMRNIRNDGANIYSAEVFPHESGTRNAPALLRGRRTTAIVPDEQPLTGTPSLIRCPTMLDLAQLINHHRSDTTAKAELIKRELIESASAVVVDKPPIRYDRNEMLWRPIDPQVVKAMVYIRRRMKELARRKR